MFLSKKYVFPDNYDELFSKIFHVIDLPGNSIDFIEVCIVEKKQVCVKRSAQMKRLFANAYGELFFEGLCLELGRDRFFELLMPEHMIDGKEQSTDAWFFKITGKSKHNFNLECARRESRTLWEGQSDLTEYTDVFSDTVDGMVKQIVVKRKIQITEILADIRDTIYIKYSDPQTGINGLTYPINLKFKYSNREYGFETWCKKSINFDLWSSFPED